MMKQIFLAGLIGISVPAPVLAQGIPVIDTTAIAKSLEQIKNQVDQLNQLKAQLDEAKKLYDAANGITNVKDLAALLGSDEIQRALPDQLGEIHGSLSGLVDEFKNQYDHFDTSGNAANNFYLQELARQKGETYGDLSIGRKVYETATKRITELEKLRDAVGTATTQKEILDLNTRISAEATLLQNDQIKMQSLAMVQRARDRVDRQRLEEERIKKLDAIGIAMENQK